MGVEVGDDEDRVATALGAGRTRDFEKTMMFSSSLEWNRMLRSQRSAGCALRMALSLVRYGIRLWPAFAPPGS